MTRSCSGSGPSTQTWNICWRNSTQATEDLQEWNSSDFNWCTQRVRQDFSSYLLVRIHTSRAQPGALPGHQMISVGLIFASQTQHPNIYHLGGASGGQGDCCSLSVLLGQSWQKSFCMRIR